MGISIGIKGFRIGHRTNC
ncbi:MAG TPA: hypothetical protein VIL89_09665 [Clostridia bacterium]